MADVSTTLDNIIAHYEFESGALTTDSHGTNTLTNVNTATEGTGIQGVCADLEKDSSQWFRVSPTNFAGLTNFSFSGWWKPESSGQFHALAALWGSGASEYGLLIRVSNNLASGLYVAFSHNGSTFTDGTVSQVFSAGTWYHIVVTFAGATGEANVYINGGSPTTFSGSATGIQNVTTADFAIGASEGSGSGQWFTDGLIDEVTITSDVITSGEVATLYNSGSGIPHEEVGGGATPFSQAVVIV